MDPAVIPYCGPAPEAGAVLAAQVHVQRRDGRIAGAQPCWRLWQDYTLFTAAAPGTTRRPGCCTGIVTGAAPMPALRAASPCPARPGCRRLGRRRGGPLRHSPFPPAFGDENEPAQPHAFREDP